MSLGLKLKILNKFVVVLLILFFASFVFANDEIVIDDGSEIVLEKTIQVGDYNITGEGLVEGVSGVQFENGEVLIEFKQGGSAHNINLKDVKGLLTSDGDIFGEALSYESYFRLSEEKVSDDKSEIVVKRDILFDEDARFEYSIPYDLWSLEGAFDLDGRYFNAVGGVIIDGDVVSPAKYGFFYVDGAEVMGSFDFVPEGILLHENTLYNSGFEEILVSEGRVLVADYPLKNYEGAYVYYDEDSLNAKGSPGVSFIYSAKSGNQLFDVRENREKLKLLFYGGGEVAAENRFEDELTPLIEVEDKFGLQIVSGRMIYTSDDVVVRKSYSDIDSVYVYSQIGASVPLEIVENEKSIIVSATNSYKVVVDGAEVLVFNDMEIPITNNYLDNDVRTVDDLRGVWPDIEFEVSVSDPERGYFSPSAQSVQVLHHWLEDHPDQYAEKYILGDTNDAWANFEDMSIYLGDALYHLPQNKEELLMMYSADRDFVGRPYSTIDHEHTHLVNDKVDGGVSVVLSGTSQGVSNDLALQWIDYVQSDLMYQYMLDEIYVPLDTNRDDLSGIYDVPVPPSEWTKEDLGSQEPYEVYYFCKSNLHISFEFGDCVSIIEMLSDEVGAPAVYSMRNYGGVGSLAKYSEVLTTFMEETQEFRVARANSDDPLVSSSYKDLAQLAYDDYILSDDECEEIMGYPCERGVLVTRSRLFN